MLESCGAASRGVSFSVSPAQQRVLTVLSERNSTDPLFPVSSRARAQMRTDTHNIDRGSFFGGGLCVSFHLKCFFLSLKMLRSSVPSPECPQLSSPHQPPASSSFSLNSPPPLPQLVENTLCIAALIPSSFILNRLHSSFSPCHSLSHSLLSLSVCLSVYLSVFRGRPSISQKSILSSFPNRISLPCCHTGFSVVPAASRLGQ